MFQTAIEKIRESVRLRLEELYEIESEYQQVLSQVVIPFSEIFKKPSSTKFSSKNDGIPFSKWDKKFKQILLKEL
ncbi:MAG: hypothetical protein KGD72_00320 [Candidatus Lokiarchaeota archaeon]|nr:hypothetical protein [Candidatus Lokiarchaeota archaeon]